MVYASGLLYDDNGCSIFWEDQFSGGIILLVKCPLNYYEHGAPATSKTQMEQQRPTIFLELHMVMSSTTGQDSTTSVTKSDQIGDSQENNKGKSRDKDNYVSWTMEDTNELLHLLVDAMNRGLRDANGSLSKQNVERIILPQLNAKTKFPKTYSHYLSRMKWFRNQYNMMSTLMRNNSGFG
ncbi:hypothetical protein JHK87_056041 [Glycine soja]|nr:hypothetical protein JHK87_056041 [Glycine soja]